jgi:hypothetical protein
MIQAFTVNNFFVDTITKSVIAKFSFMLYDELKSFERKFENKSEAKIKLEKEAKEWFLIALEDYIIHKTHIINASHPEQFKALQICQNAKIAYEKWELIKITQKFEEGFKYFQAILPHPNNNSYLSSQHNLNELLKFASNYNQKHKK